MTRSACEPSPTGTQDPSNSRSRGRAGRGRAGAEGAGCVEDRHGLGRASSKALEGPRLLDGAVIPGPVGCAGPQGIGFGHRGSLEGSRDTASACVLVPGWSQLASAALAVHPRAWWHSSHHFPPGPSCGRGAGRRVLLPPSLFWVWGARCPHPLPLCSCPPWHPPTPFRAGSSSCSPTKVPELPGPERPPRSKRS